MHDFQADLLASQTDSQLKANLAKDFKTTSLLAPVPGIPRSHVVSDIASALIDGWQGRYTSPKRLRFAVSNTDAVEAARAYSIPVGDWVVLSSGLLRVISDQADRLAHNLVGGLSGSLRLPFVERVSKNDERSNAYVEMFYASVVASFIGHEIAHHYDGHEGFSGFVCATFNPALASEYQALELGADVAGTEAAAHVARQCLAQFLPVSEAAEFPADALRRDLILTTSLRSFLALAHFFRNRPNDR